MSSGSCLCSKVKYTFTSEPAMQAVCHCNECHKVSGSAFTTNLIVPTTNFKITEGADVLKSYVVPHQSGMDLTLYFCSNCGRTLYKEGSADAFKGTVIIQAGSVDEGNTLENFKVGGELWVKQRVPWLGALDGAGQLQEFS